MLDRGGGSPRVDKDMLYGGNGSYVPDDFNPEKRIIDEDGY